VIETIVPKNIFFALSDKEDPNMLHLMFFALIALLVMVAVSQ